MFWNSFIKRKKIAHIVLQERIIVFLPPILEYDCFMKKILPLFAALLLIGFARAQNVNCYRVYLHDKANTPYSIDQPRNFLSQRCLDKRTHYNIPVTEEDLPVNPAYLHEIGQASPQLRVLAVSRWLNTAVVCCPDTVRMSYVRNLPFVDSVKAVGYYDNFDNPPLSECDIFPSTNYGSDTMIYGKGYGQIALHNGHLLHAEGYHGEGMLIAMLDAGWNGFDRSQMFTNLYENGQIWGTYNFIPGMDNVYTKHGHGTSCASIILSSFYGDEDTLVGTAPAANMVFIRTEDPDKEQLIEEDFWVAGAELADSLGADVITASLGYTQFDDSTFVYDYSSCDGRTSVASVAATKAAHKGMVVCVAAGNEGENEWHKLSRPSDAEDILCVGAVNVDSVYAPFSGCGPSYDGRVKPDVVSCGWDSYMVFASLFSQGDTIPPLLYCTIGQGNGTSCATPTLAGLATCLWQALPQYNSLEIMQLIREAGHQFTLPDTMMGYGIPDFYRIFLENYVADTTDSTDSTGIATMESIRNDLKVYPNPVTDKLVIENTGTQNHTIYIYDFTGKMVGGTEIRGGETMVMDATKWASGIYLLQANGGNGRRETVKIIRH